MRDTISLARVDSLASLLDLLEDSGVVDALVGLDGRGLGVEGDVKFLDAWWDELSVRMLEGYDRSVSMQTGRLTLELLQHLSLIHI